MGYILGDVTVARFPDGKYWAVFGNGYQSTDGKAVLFMVRVDSPSTVKMIEVGSGPNNGLSTPILVDANGDRIVDLVYAGDLKGNVWKFEYPGSNTNQWKSVYGTSPLFQAKDGSGNPQPITAPMEVGLAPSGAAGLMVYFGTGKYFETGDNSTISVQSMYGIVDEDGNGGGSTGNFSGANHRTQLQSQTIIFEATISGNGVRVVSDNSVDYATQKGWVIDLLKPPSPGTAVGERVISAPMLFGGKLLFQTIVPSLSPCEYGGGSWLMQVDPATGGEPQTATFDVNGDGLFNSADMVDIGGGVMKNASGLDTGGGLSGGFGEPIKAGDKAYVPTCGTSDCSAPAVPSGTLKSRASWRQIQ
jgi:type IV pilus assembly protein PilY1